MHLKAARRLAAATAASSLLAAGSLALATSAGAAPQHKTVHYHFVTRDNPGDVTFNQLLGINNHDLIAGYFGSGAAGAPNKGYVLSSPLTAPTYTSENFPGSVQTQVTGLNNRGVTVGFWSSMNNANLVNDNFGFYEKNGIFHTVNFPTGAPATPPVDQLLGVNDDNVAVGFYTDAAGVNHGYRYSIASGRYSPIVDPSAPTASLTAAAINDRETVAGFYVNPATGNTDGFVLSDDRRFTDLAYPGAASTLATGINRHGEVVGVVTIGSGSSAQTHGFTWTRWHGFSLIDDPNGVGTTTVNGVNDRGQLVGFYVDAAGNTDGFIASPER